MEKDIDKTSKAGQANAPRGIKYLGAINVLGKDLYISPMHDVFASHMYKDAANRETLRKILNIMAREYQGQCGKLGTGTSVREMACFRSTRQKMNICPQSDIITLQVTHRGNTYVQK